jgi:hypothetical protein
MVKHSLTVALVKSVLQVLDWMGPTGARRCRRRPRHRAHRGRRHHRTVLVGTLYLDQLHQTGEDPRAGPSCQAPEKIPNLRVRVMQRLPSPSPSPTPSAYWPMEPSDPATSPRSRQEPPCAIHGMGLCPYLVAQRQPVLSSLGMREGEEGITDVEDIVKVTVAEDEDDDGPVEVIPMLDSPPT